MVFYFGFMIVIYLFYLLDICHMFLLIFCVYYVSIYIRFILYKRIGFVRIIFNVYRCYFLILFAKRIFGTIYCANVLSAKQDYYQSSSGRLIGAFFKTSGGRFKKQDIWNKYRSEMPVGSRGRQTPQSGVGCADLRRFVRSGRSHHHLMLFLFSAIVAGVLTPVDAELWAELHL